MRLAPGTGHIAILLDRFRYYRRVDLTDLTRAVTPTLDGPVLAVLAQAGKPLTVGQVAAQMPRGSEIGVRKCLGRLVEQGIVQATEMGRNRVHALNREHLAAPVAVLFAGLRPELWSRFRKTLSIWNPGPLYGCVFGSAARGDGNAESDIDLLLVHAPLPGESDPPRSPGGRDALPGPAAGFRAAPLTERQLARWGRQVDHLRGLARGWTGNPLQVLEMSAFQWDDHQSRQSDLFREISRDAIEVVGGSL
jgi:hypothetical protein